MTTTKKAPTGALTSIAIEKIRPNPFQPRTSFDPAEIKKLAASLDSSGLLQPITVRSVDDGYELLAGERRTRAAESLGWTQIPAVVRAYTDEEMAVLGLVENLQRADLDPLDEAEGLKRLADELGWSQAKIADETGIPRSTVGDRLRALELPDAWLALLRKREIQFSHAPVIHKYREFPYAAHARVIEDSRDDYDWRDAKQAGTPISVDSFTHLLAREYGSEMHPLSELAAGYDGPVVTLKRQFDNQPRKYAVDRNKWQPLLEAKRAAEAARAKTNGSRASKPDQSQVKFAAEEKKRREKAAQLTATLRGQFAALVELAPATWDAQLWRAFVTTLAGSSGYTSMAPVYEHTSAGEKSSDYSAMDKAVRAHVAQADVTELATLALRIVFGQNLRASPYNLDKKPKDLVALAEALGTSLEAVTPKIETAPAAAPSKKAEKREAKKARRAAPDFMKLQYASPALVAVVGAEPMPRTGITMALWKYIKKHGLQDTTNRRMINADDLMRPIFGKDHISMFDMTKAVNKHLKETPWDLGDVTGAPKQARKKALAAADTEVPVRVTDDGVQAIRAAAEHDEAEAAGSGDEEFEAGESYDLVAIEEIAEAEA